MRKINNKHSKKHLQVQSFKNESAGACMSAPGKTFTDPEMHGSAQSKISCASSLFV